MRTIAVVNQQGGVGKTTTVINLAKALAEKKRKVLVIDLDTQRTASEWIGPLPKEMGVYGLFAGSDSPSTEKLIFQTPTEGVSAVPSTGLLAGEERTLSLEPDTEQRLKEKLAELPSGRFDYVLIDCSPAFGILTINALAAATEALIPVECHATGLHGLGVTWKSIESVRKQFNPDLKPSILVCRVDRTPDHGSDVVDQVRAKFREITFATEIRENAKTLGAEDYRKLAAEVIAQEGQESPRAVNG